MSKKQSAAKNLPRMAAEADALRFIGTNADLPFAVHGLFIHVRPENGRLHLYVDILDTVTADAIKKAAGTIAEWSRRLEKWQGPWLAGGPNRLKESLCASGKSPKELAEQLNKCVANYLREYHEDTSAYQDALKTGKIKTERDKLFWSSETGRWRLGLNKAKHLIKTMVPRMQDDAIAELCNEGLKNLRRGQSAFLKNGGPIPPENVRERKREWTKRRQTS